MLYLHDQIDSLGTVSFNRIEFTFDQFTGYKPQMFELANIIGVDIYDYDIYDLNLEKNNKRKYSAKVKNQTGYEYNASSYNFKYNFNPVFGINIGVIGSLRNNKEELYFALQDIIHSVIKNPIHPNNNSNKLFFGLNYNNQLWKQK